MGFIDPGHLCQLLIEVSDLNRAKAFYEKVFGWKSVPADLLEMVVMTVPDHCPFGIALIPIGNKPAPVSPQTMPTPGRLKAVFAVDDPAALVENCQAWGGNVVSGPRIHAGYGVVWELCDPDGLTWGLFKKA